MKNIEKKYLSSQLFQETKKKGTILPGHGQFKFDEFTELIKLPNDIEKEQTSPLPASPFLYLFLNILDFFHQSITPQNIVVIGNALKGKY